MQKAIEQKSRLESLDYLRGYFVIVIIADHLWRYPSLFALISGEAKLWMTAAEGFVIISGFLIGYVRGFKGLKDTFKTIATKLFKRSVVLYIAMAATSILYIAIEWTDIIRGMPYTPMVNGIRSWGEALANIFVMTNPHTWVHFLALYARFLVIAVPIVWLLRKKKAWLVALLSVSTYLIGIETKTEWMVWQILFFLPSVAGFYFNNMRNWWMSLDIINRRIILTTLYAYFIITVAISAITAFNSGAIGKPFFSALDTQFNADAMWPPRIINAFLWFTALAFIFHRITPMLKKWTYGVIAYIGTHSLQAYLAHGLIICLINLTLSDSTSWIVNSLYGLTAVLGAYAFIRLPIINKALPR